MGRDAHIGEADLRRALAVLGRIAAPGHARSVRVDKEEADPVPIATRALHPARDDQPIGAVALADEGFFSVQHESVAVLDRSETHIVQVKARLFLHMSKTQPEIASRDRADQFGALLIVRAMFDQRAA